MGWKVFSVFSKHSFSQVDFNDNAPLLLGFSIVLMGINWSLEAVKWKQLVASFKVLSFRHALKGVLAGLSTGILTPNRLGNFIGRTVFVDPEYKVKAALLTMLANLAQFVVTIFFGCLGLLILGLHGLPMGSYWIVLSAVLVLLLGLRIYIDPAILNRKPFNYFFSDKIVEGISFVGETSLSLKLRVLSYSAGRYLVFVIQYVLIISAFWTTDAILTLGGGVMVVYLLMTLIPSFFFGKLFVREAAALFVLAEIGIPDSIILVSGFLLWLVNIGVPALVGTLFLLRKK